MAKLSRKKGITSQFFHVFIQDSSATTGAGLTGLAFNTAGLACKYINAGGTLSAAITLEDITTLGTYAAPTSNAHMRFKELNSASPSQGMYEIQVHNDWMNLTGGNIVVMMAGATNMAQLRFEIDLQADVNTTHVAGTAQTGRDLGASVLLSNGTGVGQVSLSSGLVTLAGVTHTGAVIPTVTNLTNLPAITANWLTAAGLAADAVTEIQAGLATAAALAIVEGFIDLEVAAILALLDDPRAEPGQNAPPVNPDLATKIDYLYAWTRNRKTNDGTTTKFYADNGTTVNQKQTTSEAAGTVEKSEIISGP